ncbi:MAG: phage tail protein [Defluviitaleaceae bacterium]|nr:phage tail protein [Defluviitaleaceae bacterium]
MAEFKHGVSARQAETSLTVPNVAGSGITFVVGTSPAHMVEGGKVQEPVFGDSYNQAVRQLGYSDMWTDENGNPYYSLCEVMFTHYRLYGVQPVIFVNVLDPEKHGRTVDAQTYQVVDGRVRLPLEALIDTVEVSNYQRGGDYELFYDNNGLVLEILEGGSISPTTTALSVGYVAVDPSQVTKNDIIGGFDIVTKQYTGFELIDSVFSKFNVVTDIVICPGWSHDPEVAAIMDAKCQAINGIFTGKCIIDADTNEVRHFADTVAWKRQNNIFGKMQILCWPKLALGDRVFNFSSQLAAHIGQNDTRNGSIPSDSPSNRTMQINTAVLADGTEVWLELNQANMLNSNGVVTVMNFIGGYVCWGNWTACFPANTDVKDFFINVSRMFGWVGNSLILSFWNRIDRRMTARFADSIVDSGNIWLNGLSAAEHLLGGRLEFRPEDNTLVDIMSGTIRIRVFMTPPSPAREIEFIQEYDVSYVMAAFGIAA